MNEPANNPARESIGELLAEKKLYVPPVINEQADLPNATAGVFTPAILNAVVQN